MWSDGQYHWFVTDMLVRTTHLVSGNKECDQLVPDVLGGETSACFWITAFQHSIQQVTLVFTAFLPLFDQL